MGVLEFCGVFVPSSAVWLLFERDRGVGGCCVAKGSGAVVLKLVACLLRVDVSGCDLVYSLMP